MGPPLPPHRDAAAAAPRPPVTAPRTYQPMKSQRKCIGLRARPNSFRAARLPPAREAEKSRARAAVAGHVHARLAVRLAGHGFDLPRDTVVAGGRIALRGR